MLNFISIISNINNNQIKNLDGFKFLPDGTNYDRQQFICESAGFWIAGEKSEIEKQVYEDDRVLFILSGYILYDKLDYNSNTAKQLIELLNTNGTKLINELSGAFYLIFYDKINQKLTVSNDRLGIKALYYYKDEDKLIFASDIKPIIFSKQIKKEINWRSWGDIFNYGFIIGDKTPFENVISLPMASILTYNKGNFEIDKYWTLNDVKINYKQNEKEIINNGIEILKSLSYKYERFIKNAIVPLSGGFDSRCIACCLKFFSDIKFDTITSNLHASGLEDTVIANQVSKSLGVKHTEVSDENLYKKFFIDMVFQVDGMTYEHLWAMSLRNKLASNIISFDGILIDVLLRPVGDITARDSDNIDYQEYRINELFNEYFLTESSVLKDFFSQKINEHFNTDPKPLFKQIKDINKYIFTFLFLNNRTRNSISTGSNSIIGYNRKILFFFYHNDLIEYIFSIPPHLKSKKEIYSKILQKAFPTIMSIPTTNDQSFLRIVKREFLEFARRLLRNDTFTKLLKSIGVKSNTILRQNRLKQISAFPINPEDKNYLLNLIKKLEFPNEFDKISLLKEIDIKLLANEKIDSIIVPIANFLVWYNLFFLGKSREELISI